MGGAADADMDAEAGVAAYQEVSAWPTTCHVSLVLRVCKMSLKVCVSCRAVLQGGGYDLGSGPEQPNQATSDAWGLGGAVDAAWLSQHDGGQPAAEQAAEEAAPAVEVTWELILQWADYYRSQGSTEEELRAWIATSYPAFAHHLAELPALEGASGWAQQLQQEGHDGVQVDGGAGQTANDSHSNRQAAEHSADTAAAPAAASGSVPGSDAAGQPEFTGTAQGPRVLSSAGTEVPLQQQLEQSAQGADRPHNEVQYVATEYGQSTEHTVDATGTEKVWLDMCRDSYASISGGHLVLSVLASTYPRMKYAQTRPAVSFRWLRRAGGSKERRLAARWRAPAAAQRALRPAS